MTERTPGGIRAGLIIFSGPRKDSVELAERIERMLSTYAVTDSVRPDGNSEGAREAQPVILARLLQVAIGAVRMPRRRLIRRHAQGSVSHRKSTGFHRFDSSRRYRNCGRGGAGGGRGSVGEAVPGRGGGRGSVGEAVPASAPKTITTPRAIRNVMREARRALGAERISLLRFPSNDM
jgi:hypothetical protein